MAKKQGRRLIKAAKERIAESFGRSRIVSGKRMEQNLGSAEAALKGLVSSKRIPEAERQSLGKIFGRLITESKYVPFDSRALVLEEFTRSAQGLSGGEIPLSEGSRLAAKFRILNYILQSPVSIFSGSKTSYPKSESRIRYKRSHRFTDGSIARNVFALNVAGAGDVAVFNLRAGKQGEFVVDFIRETAGSSLPNAERLMKMPWYEAVGNRLASAQKQVIEQGFLLRMPEGIHETSPEFAKLFLSGRASENALYFNPASGQVRQRIGKYYILLPGAMPKVDLSRLPESVLRGRKPPEQRESDRYRTRERLEKRGLKFMPETDTVNAKYTRDRSYSDYKELTGVDFEGLFKGKRGLDVGCGYGKFVEQARKKGILVEGVDPVAPEGEYFHRVLFHEFKPKHKYDFVVSIESIPKYNKSAYSRRLNLYLLLKCLVPGGMLIMNPFLAGREHARLQGNVGIWGSTIRKMEKLGFEIDCPEQHQERIIIGKKSEEQVERLGRMLGVI
ncbi:MAG: methyltransferase domain-containing protein [Candidatus Diapherotrites archaeon]|nr:methyltransferase domain-containing protein [Candidatus Diapherotrites archaeon]